MYRLKWPAPFGILGTVLSVTTVQGFSRLVIQPFSKPGEEREGKGLWVPSWIWKEVLENRNNLMYFEVNPNSLFDDEPIIRSIRVLAVTKDQMGVVWECGAF
jgi:hypothetical protein